MTEPVPRDWERWVEFTDGHVLNLTGLSPDDAVDAVRVEIRGGRILRNTYHRSPAVRSSS